MYRIRRVRFGVSPSTFLVRPKRIGRSIETCYMKRHQKEKTARLVKQHLPSVSTGRPQLLRTNIRHAVAAYGLMVTVQSELRRSAVRNATRKTARVISAALCTPPNDRPVLLLSFALSTLPRNARGMPPECPRKNVPRFALPKFSEIKTLVRARAWFFWRHLIIKFMTQQISVTNQRSPRDAKHWEFLNVQVTNLMRFWRNYILRAEYNSINAFCAK